MSLSQKTANFQREEMIVTARSIPYGVGPYQLIFSGRLAVPLWGKTGSALYVFFLPPLTSDFLWLNLDVACAWCNRCPWWPCHVLYRRVAGHNCCDQCWSTLILFTFKPLSYENADSILICLAKGHFTTKANVYFKTIGSFLPGNALGLCTPLHG